MARGRRISKRQESTSSMSWFLLSCAIFLICILLLYAVNSLGTKTLLYQNHNTDSEKNAIQLPKRPEQLINSIYGAIANKSNNSLAVNDSQASNASELANVPLPEQSEIQNISNDSNISQENKENINKPQENESKENINRPWKTQENVDKSQENESKENIDKSQENESKENIDKSQENESKENIDRPWKNKENESKDKDDVVRPWKSKNNDSKKEISEYKRIKKDKEEKEQQTKGKGKENKEKEQTNKKKDVKEQDKKEKDKKEKEDPKKDSKDKKDDKGKPIEAHLGMLYLKTTPGNWIKEAVQDDRVLLSLLEKSTQFRIGIHLYDTNYIRRLALENSEVVSVDNPSQMFEKVFKPKIEESFTQVRFHDSKAEYSGIGKVKKREGTGISKDKKLRMKYYALLVQMKFKTQYYYCVFGMPFSEYKRNPRAIETILRTMYFKEK